MKEQNKFNNIKNNIRNIINNINTIEITPTTSYKKSGIYLIYIDNFEDDKIIPTYIGQAVDMQRRYVQHLTELLSLNRLSYDEYYKYFFSEKGSFYEGSFKTCKIFKYMIEHKCELSDFHMIILEEVLKEELNAKEQEYFNMFLPSLVGFNQINSYTEANKLFRDKNATIVDYERYLQYLITDISNISEFYEFGFTEFNYTYAFPQIIDWFPIEIQMKLQIQINNLYEKVDKLNLKIGFYDVVKEKKLLYKKYNELRDKGDIWQEAYKEYREFCSKCKNEKLELIFPQTKFQPFTLKDRAYIIKPIEFGSNSELNFCKLNIYISNNGMNKSIYAVKHPDIIRIDFAIKSIDKSIYGKSYYIENDTTQNLQKGLKYIEKDFYEFMIFKKIKFKITNASDDFFDYNNSFISIASECKNGFNDYTIINQTLYSLDNVINDIITHINEDTIFDVNISESYNCLKKCFDKKLLSNRFVELLINNKLPKKRKAIGISKKNTQKENIISRADRYKQKILLLSNNNIEVLDYKNSREDVTAHCAKCGYIWNLRSDKLLAKLYCPFCRK